MRRTSMTELERLEIAGWLTRNNILACDDDFEIRIPPKCFVKSSNRKKRLIKVTEKAEFSRKSHGQTISDLYAAKDKYPAYYTTIEVVNDEFIDQTKRENSRKGRLF